MDSSLFRLPHRVTLPDDLGRFDLFGTLFPLDLVQIDCLYYSTSTVGGRVTVSGYPLGKKHYVYECVKM